MAAVSVHQCLTLHISFSLPSATTPRHCPTLHTTAIVRTSQEEAVFNDGDEEDEYDDRLRAQRQALALALRARQKELSKQMSCSRCAAPLIQPTRLLACRHVLCAKCGEH